MFLYFYFGIECFQCGKKIQLHKTHTLDHFRIIGFTTNTRIQLNVGHILLVKGVIMAIEVQKGIKVI